MAKKPKADETLKERAKPTKAIYTGPVLVEKLPLQAPTVDSLHDAPQELSKTCRHLLEFFVIWIVQNGLIDVPHQMEQAFLLRARQRIVCRIEVGHQNTPKSLESLARQLTLTRFGVESKPPRGEWRRPIRTLACP
jgi:hypothetical protein